MYISAGIVLYNPNIDRLKENIEAIITQVDYLIIIDNDSRNKDIVEKEVKAFNALYTDKIELISNDSNRGVAYALNQIMIRSKMLRAKWVLTLDQDTVVYDNLVAMYKEFIDTNTDNKVASLTCLRNDRNYSDKGVIKTTKAMGDMPFCQVNTAITSGNLVSINAWDKVNGFKNKLFIDMVDDEFSLNLTNSGYKIICINQYGFLHELGSNLRKVRFLGKDKIIFGYPPIRKYYTARNITYIIKAYNLDRRNEYSKYLWKKRIGALLYEKNKIANLKAFSQGIKDGKKLECTE